MRSGAQVLQLFDSWGQHLSPDQFSRFAKPYAERVIIELKARHPETPIIYFAHGSGGYLERQADTAADMLSLDWRVDMATARRTLGANVAVAGNIDPLVLFAPEEQIRASVRECIDAAGPKGHILNLGACACGCRSRDRHPCRFHARAAHPRPLPASMPAP